MGYGRGGGRGREGETKIIMLCDVIGGRKDGREMINKQKMLEAMDNIKKAGSHKFTYVSKTNKQTNHPPTAARKWKERENTYMDMRMQTW